MRNVAIHSIGRSALLQIQRLCRTTLLKAAIIASIFERFCGGRQHTTYGAAGKHGGHFTAAVFSILCVWAPSSSALVVLQYHHISDKTPSATSTPPELFRQHLKAIEAAKFGVMDIRVLAKKIRAGESLPDKTVVITFDDGYRSIYTTAWPELKKRKWPFTVFVNTEPHDREQSLFMSWSQLKELQVAGNTIANHTIGHAHLIRKPKNVPEKAWDSMRREEILGAQKRLKTQLGEAPKLFAYPYGEYDEALQALLRREGFLAFGQQSGPIAKSSHPQALPRFPFGGAYGGIDDFKTKLYTLAFPNLRTVVEGERGGRLSAPLLPGKVRRPVLRLSSPVLPHIAPVNCYASGQGRISSDRRGETVVAQAPKALPAGRSRYNCTASAGHGRFYWHSEMFIRKRADGSFVPEA